MRKQIAQYFFLFIVCGWLSTSVQSQPNSDNGRGGYWINSVNHNDHTIVINDRIYKMPITLETYIANQKGGKDRKVNRYALKEGQLVLFKESIKNRIAYINKITIYPQ